MFSLKRYGDEVFTPTVRGRSFHSDGTGAMFSLKRYGGETVRERVCHSNDMAAKFSLTRRGGDVFTHSVRGRGCHSNGTGARFALKRYGDEVFTQTVRGETFGYSWKTLGECVGTFPWEFVRQKRSNYRPHRSTRM